MSSSPKQRWAVVGGGMMGLTLAHRLAQQGQHVTLFEAAPSLGGLASAWSLGDLVWDRHYHVTLLSDTRLRALLSEVGLEGDMRWIVAKTGFYSNGQLHSLSSSIDYLRFPLLTLWEKMRLAATILYASRCEDWKRFEQVRVADWLLRWSGRGTFDKVWLPLLRSKLGEAYQRTAASFIWAYIARMYKARRTGLKQDMFGYVPGGYASILQRFAQVLQAAGVEIECGMPIRCVTAQEDGTVNLAFANDQPDQEFDQVILTLPAPIISRICPQLDQEERSRWDAIEYLGIVCASVLLKKRLSPYYVTNITDSGIPLTGVIEMTNIVSPEEMGGRHLVYLPRYLLSDDPGFEESDETLRERWMATLERMYPHFSRDDVLAFRVSRARHVMSLPTLNYSENLPPMQTSLPGVSVISSAHILKGNLNVNETVEVAEDAFRDLLLPLIRRGPARDTQHHVEAPCELVARS